MLLSEMFTLLLTYMSPFNVDLNIYFTLRRNTAHSLERCVR